MDLFTDFIAFIIFGSVVLFAVVIYGIAHLQKSEKVGEAEEGIKSPIPVIDKVSLHDEAKKNYEEVEQRFLVNSAIFTTTAAATAIPEVEGAILTNLTVVDSYEYDESISDDVEEYSYESTVVDVDVEEYEEEIFYANGTNDINDFMTNPYNDFIDEDPYESPISNFDSEEGFTSYPSFEEDYDYDRNPYDYPGESVEIDENYHHLI